MEGNDTKKLAPKFNPKALAFNPTAAAFSPQATSVPAPMLTSSTSPNATHAGSTVQEGAIEGGGGGGGEELEVAEVEQMFQDQLLVQVDDYPQALPHQQVFEQQQQLNPHQIVDPYIYETGSILPYHLYAPPETFTHGLLANQRTIQQFFIDEDIRKDLTQRLDTLSKRPQQQQPSRNHQQQQQQKLPEKVNQYHTLLQIKSKHKSHLYRATSESDGKFYFLKRFEGFTLLVGPEFLDSLKPWTSSGAAGGLGVLGRHPNIVAFREAFTTKSFHDDSLIFVYEYHPNVVPLGEKYLKVNTTTASASSSVAPNTSGSHGTTQNQQRQIQERLQMAAMQRKSGSAGVSGPGGGRGRLDDAHVLDEATIWSLICQIISALKAIHNAGLAYRNMNTQKILISGGGGNSSNRLGGDYSGRLRLSCCGIPDALFFNHGMINVFQYQQEDLIKFGEVLIALTCRGKSFPDLNTSLAYISQTYSQSMYQIIGYLLSASSPAKNIDELAVMMAPKILQQMEHSQMMRDRLEQELMHELENSRLLRLLIKLGFINERPEFGMDSQWSETGDRYLLKLFRDHVFHQVDANGRPVLDIAHVIRELNKFDAGSDERMVMTSRDERSCLVVSYQDLKKCAESAFGELLKSSSHS